MMGTKVIFRQMHTQIDVISPPASFIYSNIHIGYPKAFLDRSADMGREK